MLACVGDPYVCTNFQDQHTHETKKKSKHLKIGYIWIENLNIHVLKTIKWKVNTIKTEKKVLLSFKLTSVFRSWGRRLHHVSRHYAWMVYTVEWIYIKHGSVCNLAFIPAVFTCIFECSKKVSAYLDMDASATYQCALQKNVLKNSLYSRQHRII